MGVRGLWGIMRPGMRQVPVSQLAGQRLAVDLSIWVVEVVNTQMHGVVTKPHLRNIFFRVAKLLELNVQLIFCVEGEAPPLKARVMAERNAVRFGAEAGNSKAKPAKTNRSRFRSTLKECTDLLDILGVPWIQSPGEAEAACAMLNQLGIVDGVITEDGDAFLYGAKRVYKNFGCDAKKDLLIDVYEDNYIYETLALNQEKLIALGLFLGCDYFPDGIKGIGRTTAIKVMAAWPRHGCFARLKMWKTRSQSVIEDYLTKCEAVDCRHNCAKSWSSLSKDILQLESKMVKKVEPYDGFPDMRVTKEFLQVEFPRRRFFEDFGSKLSQRPWPCPDARRFVNWSNVKMEWVVDYAVAKVLPLVTLWKIRNLTKTPSLRLNDPRFTDPLRIVKKRILRGNPVFEVEWSRFEFHEEDGEGEEEEKLIYNTMEPEDMFRGAYPTLYAQFEEREEGKKKKAPTGKKKAGAATKKATATTTTKATFESVPGSDLISIESAMKKMNLKPCAKMEKDKRDDDECGRQKDNVPALEDDVFDNLIKDIEGKNSLKTMKSKKLPSLSQRVCHKPFSISSSESEDELTPQPLSRSPPESNYVIKRKVGKEQKRRMSFFQIKELEDSLNVELERRIELNLSVMRERGDGDGDGDGDDDGDCDDDDDNDNDDNGVNHVDDVLQLTFDLSYGNFSFQTSIDETQTPLRPLQNAYQAGQILHSTPLLPPTTAKIETTESPPLDSSPDKENKPVFDLDSSLDSPLPLRERLKRGLL